MLNMKVYQWFEVGMHIVTFVMVALVMLAYGVTAPHLYVALGVYAATVFVLFLGRWISGEFED